MLYGVVQWYIHRTLYQRSKGHDKDRNQDSLSFHVLCVSLLSANSCLCQLHTEFNVLINEFSNSQLHVSINNRRQEMQKKKKGRSNLVWPVFTNWTCYECATTDTRDSYHSHSSADCSEPHRNWASLVSTVVCSESLNGGQQGLWYSSSSARFAE
jgi:hypothetical protein